MFNRTNHYVQTDYDAEQRVIRRVDETGVERTYEYNNQGQLVREMVTNPANPIIAHEDEPSSIQHGTAYHYDASHNLTHVEELIDNNNRYRPRR